MWEPVLLPPVLTLDGEDGAILWPGWIPGTWVVCRTLDDIPEYYQRPPRRWVEEDER